MEATCSFWKECSFAGEIDQAGGEVIEVFLDAGDLLAVARHDGYGVVAWRDVFIRIEHGLAQVGEAALASGAGKIGTDGLAAGRPRLTVAALAFVPEEGFAAGGVTGGDGVVVPVDGADEGDDAADVVVADAGVVAHFGAGDSVRDGAEEVVIGFAGAKDSAREIGSTPAAGGNAVARSAVNAKNPLADIGLLSEAQTGHRHGQHTFPQHGGKNTTARGRLGGGRERSVFGKELLGEAEGFQFAVSLLHFGRDDLGGGPAALSVDPNALQVAEHDRDDLSRGAGRR